jgi:hypothetical protein
MGRFFRFFYDKKTGYPRWRDSHLLVHRTVAKPKEGEVVHHKDGNPHNFRKDNLVNMSRSEHAKLHAKKKRSFWDIF